MSAFAVTGDHGPNLLRLAIEFTILSVAAVVVAALAWFVPPLREWLTATLAFGWLPAGLYATAALLVLLHRPLNLFTGWRWWLAAALFAGILIGAAGFVRGDSGPLYAYGMSGAWGYALTGGNPVVAILELAAATAIIGLLVIPHSVRLYWTAARYAIAGLWIATVAVARVMAVAGRLLFAAMVAAARGTAALINARRGNGSVPKQKAPKKPKQPKPESPETETTTSPLPTPTSGSGWQLPPVDILAPAEPHQMDQSAISGMSDDIKEALSEHGVYVDIEDVKAGPRVIRFGLVPGYVPQKTGRDGSPAKQRPSRVRVGDITKQQKDLALALKSPYIRIIETPEPGEGLVGLEVPNPTPGKVLMRSIIEGQDFGKIVQKGGLAFALGEDAGGASLVLDLAAMPHLLIAGATGSGKSVCINSLVASLLMTRPPDELRMIMVDPKRVELTPFNGIPHLVMPVIVEPDEVQPALRGLINEMTRRYKMMEDLGVRNIAGYNAKSPEPMSFLVLIVDELADLMMTGGLEVEQQLVRLAQLGRAAGIHMVLATQRPSVKVVTGLLKANVPARVAFAVASQVDSRVILDSGGAEALMGKGDLLLLNNDFPKARRGQGTLVYDDEMDRLIDFWREQKGPPLPNIDLAEEVDPDGADPGAGESGGENGFDGNYLDQARDIALRNPRVTSAMLERRFKIRKSVADEIMDDLRAEGLVIG